MKRINAMVALAAMGLAAPAWAATDAECQDMWKKADANSDGVLSDRESHALCRADARRQPHHGQPRAGSPRPSSWMPARPTSTRRARPTRARR